MSNRRLTQAVLHTLTYADIFDYPMKFSEIWKYLICSQKVSKKTLREFIQRNNSYFGKKGNYFFLHGREENVEERKQRHRVSQKKMEKAKRTAYILSFIPTIKLIGVSGSLSMDNSREDHDIDFFIVTSNHALWMTRFFIYTVLLCLGNMRRKHADQVADKICPNMLLTIQHMAMDQKNRNLFVVHEIAQLKVVVNKEYTYEKFLRCNAWITTFLPNAMSAAFVAKSVRYDTPVQSSFSHFRSYVLSWILKSVDAIFFAVQFWYMRKEIENETVTRHIAKFHPIDREGIVLSLYKRKLLTGFMGERYVSQTQGARKMVKLTPLLPSFNHGFLT